MSPKAFTAFVFLMSGLFAIVVIVGLYQRILDATGVAMALATLLGGVITGAALRGRSDDKSEGGDHKK